MALVWNFPGGGFGSVIRLVFFSFLFFFVLFFVLVPLSLFDSIRPVPTTTWQGSNLCFIFPSIPQVLSLSLVSLRVSLLSLSYLFILFYSVFIFCVSPFFGVPRSLIY